MVRTSIGVGKWIRGESGMRLLPRWISTGVLLSFSSVAFVLGILCAATLVPGCFNQTTSTIDRNLAPETFLVGVPGDSSTTFYRVRLYWNGNDSDGEVVAYEWATTDSLPPPEIEYHRTTRSDTVMVFTVE